MERLELMKIELAQKRPWKTWTLIGVFTFFLSYAVYALTTESVRSISSSQLAFETVESGALDIYSSVYGEFASAQERLLTAPAQGKVSEIFIRPGTQVVPETVILKLSNPKLEQEVNQARGELAQQKAQREAFKYEQQNELLNYQGRIADIEANIERAKLELSINKKLLSQGSASKIEFQRAELALKQEQKRLKFEQQKYQQFQEMQSYQLTQRDITINQQESQVALLQMQLDNMHVKAGIQGSLQTLEAELGQSVQMGESLAKVGSDKSLIAKLRLPQNQADQIDINAPVIIDTQKGLIKAKISRIESVVTNGSVMAEAVLIDQLTSNARPSLSISAQVFIKHDKDAVFIKQVSGIRPRSKQTVFVKNQDSLLVQRDVVFGELTSQKLIVSQGLAPGEVIVSSDISKYEKFRKLAIVD